MLMNCVACYPGGVDGAKGLYVFGDSFTDTGETIPYPYGMTWPGIRGKGNRSSDGRNEVDYLGKHTTTLACASIELES